MPSSYKPIHSYLVTPMRGNIRSFLTSFMSPDVYVWPEPTDAEPSNFYLASPHLDDASSPQKLVDRTASLMAVFEGAMLLVFGMQSERLRLRTLLDENTLPSKFLTGMENNGNVLVRPFSEDAVTRRCADVEDPFGDPVAMLVFLARYDKVTLDLLKYLGFNGISYLSLYALLDWMTHEAPRREDRKKDDFVAGPLQWDIDRAAAEAGWSKTTLGRFTATANNPTYLGPASRHGGTDDLPSRPMALEVAEGPLRLATRRYLAARAFSIDLRAKWLALIR